MKNIPLKKNTYTDGGYRFVLNNYFRQDNWYKIDSKKKYSFLSFTTFNHDVYHNTNAGWDQETIAKYYFRLDIDVFTHSRALYSVMDLMSDVGGTSKAIMFTLVLTLGGASFFSSRVEMMLHLYSDKGLFRYFDLADLTDKDSKAKIKRSKSMHVKRKKEEMKGITLKKNSVFIHHLMKGVKKMSIAVKLKTKCSTLPVFTLAEVIDSRLRC